jgi:serine phosphatase RsbU (regulator of sigma subunit)
MPRVILLSLLGIPMTAASQDFIEVPYPQCVWRAGDDSRWAAQNLNEDDWTPYTQWKATGDEPRIWVRCHADISRLDLRPREAIQIRLYGAYEVYLDGEKIGSIGDMGNGSFSMNTVRVFQLLRPLPRTHEPTIALRITYRLFEWWPTGTVPSLEIWVGDENALRARRTSVALTQAHEQLVNTICFCIIGVIGVMLLGLSLQGTTRRELHELTLVCLALPPIYLNSFCAASLVDYPATEYVLICAVAAAAANTARTLFFFAIGTRRVPVLFWMAIVVGIASYVVGASARFLSPQTALQVDTFRAHWLDPLSTVARIGVSAAPFYVFWPYWRLEPRMRPPAALCMAWGATMMLFFAILFLGLDLVSLATIRQHWGQTVSHIEAFTTLAVIITLLALLFHDQQQTAEERAILAGEMQAAKEIQRMLAPGIVRTAPGVQIEVAFHPVREVGGDFFLCRVLPDGCQRLLLGDVSGKGAAAAMTAALLLGGAQARESDTPAELLRHLNRVLRESGVGGFATCVCADLASDGSLVISNAGHLAPYYKGEELVLPTNLPLGLCEAKASYEEYRFELTRGDSLTFLSDGVVEARDTSGGLFGFDRTRVVSAQSAQLIAETAKRFGQEDDITVVRLVFAPDSVLEA